MNVLHCIVLINLYVITKGEGYYVSNKPVTASHSIKGYGGCQLAVPVLIYSPDGVIVDVDRNIVTEDVWIGYYREKTAMEYFGCVKTDGYKPSYNTISDPGYCLSACGGYNAIGIYDTKCFCFEKEDEIKDTLSSHCTNSCAKYDYVCGGLSSDGNTYMSLYRSIGSGVATTGDTANDKRCLFNENKIFDWEKCTTKFAFICENVDGTAWLRDDELNWEATTNVCFEGNARPSTYNNSKLIWKEDKLWTGVVRSYVIYKYLNESLLTGKFAYLKKEHENIVLKWSDYDKMKTVLCVKETTTEPPPTTSTKPTVKVTTTPVKPSSPPTSTVKKTTAAITDSTASSRTSEKTKLPSKTTTLDFSTTTKTSTTISSQTKTDHTNSKLNSNNKTGPSNVVVIVGSTVSAVIVIVIVIVAVILCIRRRGNKEKRPSHQMSDAYAMSAPGQNEQSTDSQEEYADIDMTSAATADEPESDYCVLEKTDKTQDSTNDGRVKRNDKNAATPYSNSGFEDGPYDTTEGVHMKPNTETINPYSHLGGYEEESLDYDHIGKNKSTTTGPGATDAENTYNTTILGYLKTSNDHKLASFEKETPDYDHIGYDTAGNAASRNMADEDSTYDKTNLGFLKTSAGTSDNIYNVTGENGVDDTYSHINAKKTHQTGLKSSENYYDTFKK